MRNVSPALVIGVMGLVASSLVASSLVASSGRADDQSAFSQLLNDQTLQQRILDAAGRSTVMIQNPCPSAHYAIDNKLFIHTAPTLDSSGRIVGGEWRHAVHEEGCGQTRVLNVLVRAQGQSTLSTMPLLPGTTHAGPVLQKDAVKYAVQTVIGVPGGYDPNCKIGYVEDTEFVSQESTAVQGGREPPWRELWTLVSCVQKMQVPMLFVPDSTGTSISAGPNNAVKVIPLLPSGP
jgi:hypothetical protein